MSAFQADGPGSIPGWRKDLIEFFFFFVCVCVRLGDCHKKPLGEIWNRHRAACPILKTLLDSPNRHKKKVFQNGGYLREKETEKESENGTEKNNKDNRGPCFVFLFPFPTLEKMLASFLVVLGLVCAAQAHVSALGSRGPLPHDPDFFKVWTVFLFSFAPCCVQLFFFFLLTQIPFLFEKKKADGISPCPATTIEDARYEVFAGSSFPIAWSLWVNHNIPPNPVGSVNFNFFAGNVTAGGNFTELGSEPITTQNTKIYWTFESQIPADFAGDATIQVYYDINGASSPFPGYYQCIDLNVIAPAL